MKYLFIALLAMMVVACGKDPEQPKDYVTLSGSITDRNSDSIVIQNRTYNKTIQVNADGTFKDTLKVETGMYLLFDGSESTNVYLQNGYDIHLTMDTKMFDETIKYSGQGAPTNNYLAQKILMEETLYPPSLFDYEEADFKNKVSEISTRLGEFLEQHKDIDSTLYQIEKTNVLGFEKEMLASYAKQQERERTRAQQFAHFIGKPSPQFTDYENYAGGTTSLSDLKGKYVYVDVWATWCGPCLAEIPFLKAMEKEYHGKNIEFVSISVDNGRGYKERTVAASKVGWKDMIAEKAMGGIQLFADNAWESSFVQEYNIDGIPRFILIDPNGLVVNADAPRPSSPKLKTLFESFNL